MHVRWQRVCGAVLLGVTAAAQAAPPPAVFGPTPPPVAPADQKYITWAVRGALDQFITDGTTRAVPHQPAQLAELRCQVAITLRQGGFACAVGVSPAMPILEAAQWAAIEALKVAAATETVDREWLARTTIEIEALGGMEPTPIVPYWGSAQTYWFLEPGIHGIALQLRGATAAMRPSEFISSHTSARAALGSLNERMNPAHESHQGMMASWFRSTHWHEVEPGGRVVWLQRGMVLVRSDEITDDRLADSARSLADYMLYRQNPEGEFSYQYEPATNSYTESNDYVRQTDAAWGLASYARRTGDAAIIAAADRAIAALAKHVIDLGGEENASYFLGPDRTSDLGATALLCLALTDHARAAEYTELRDKLVGAMLWLQQPSGRFLTVFPPTLTEVEGDAFAGQALLALARVHAEQPHSSIERAFASALPVYRRSFQEAPRADSVPWQSRAFALMARLTGRREYAEFAFELNDWLIGHQLTEANCAWPELHGGFVPPRGKRATAAAAICLEGLADALELARERGDNARARRYHDAARWAARFVVQLQFRRDEGFYVRSGLDCYRGIRRAPWDNRIRIDDTARALRALTDARRAIQTEPRP